MSKIIKVFDHEGKAVGQTFLRRAKQLVLKGRATWLDVGSIGLLGGESMDIPQGNGEFIDLRHEVKEEIKETESDALLMYLAKQNIARRRNLLVHILAWPTTLLALALATGGFSSRGGPHPEFYVGVFFVWGIFIAKKAFVVGRQYFRNRRPEVDKVKEEFERMKRGGGY